MVVCCVVSGCVVAQVYEQPIIDMAPLKPVEQTNDDQPTLASPPTGANSHERLRRRRRMLNAAGQCDCKTTDFDINPDGTATTE